MHFTDNEIKEQRINVILCKPGKKARMATVPNQLTSFQKIVGGYIEAVYPFEDPIAIICNEEGKFKGMDVNRSLRDSSGKVYDILVGTFLVTGLSEYNFASLSNSLQEKYYAMFEYPEIFFRVGDEILAVPTSSSKHIKC